MPDTAQPNDLLQELAAALGPEAVSTGQDEWLSRDIFFWDGLHDAAMICTPRTAEEVQAVLGIAARHGAAVSSRGGGMSYTAGYRPKRPDTILLDLRQLNAVREVNITDRYVIAEAGATWDSVTEALKPDGVRVELQAPFSGIYSTVGGALSQNVPQGMKGVLGVEVVRANGDVVRTGAWARAGQEKPFVRHYGPDLTGLFIGDGGAFGVKTAAALQVRQVPNGLAYGSFAFETYEEMAQTMIELGPYDFVSRRVGLDPFKSQNAAKVGFKEAIATLGAVSGEGKTLIGGAMNAAKMAATGANFMDGVKWSLHLTIEGVDDRAAEAALEIVRSICTKLGREIPNILPQAMAARGYSVRGFLGKDGQRWVPTNSLFPLSRAPEIAAAIQAFFETKRAEMNRLNIVESYMTNYGETYFMCEPSFYWTDEVSELHLRHLGAEEAKKFKDLPPNEEKRAFVKQLRKDLTQTFQDLGAVHVQLGKCYEFNSTLRPETRRLVEDVKAMLDPDGLLNPGNLGLN